MTGQRRSSKLVSLQDLGVSDWLAMNDWLAEHFFFLKLKGVWRTIYWQASMAMYLQTVHALRHCKYFTFFASWCSDFKIFINPHVRRRQCGRSIAPLHSTSLFWGHFGDRDGLLAAYLVVGHLLKSRSHFGAVYLHIWICGFTAVTDMARLFWRVNVNWVQSQPPCTWARHLVWGAISCGYFFLSLSCWL